MSSRWLSTDTSDVEFRLRTLRTGVWPSVFACVCMGVYYALTWDRPGRAVLCILSALSLAATVAIATLPVARLVEGRAREPFFLGWSLGLITLIAVGAGIDGGATSPIAAMLFLPLVYAALSYPLGSMLVVGVADVAAYATVALLGGGMPAENAFLVGAALVNAAWISTWQSRNHHQQRHQLSRASRTDVLTEALNRRGFAERFAAELERARRDNTPLALVTVDLDDFKAINDHHGHAAGDRVLQSVANTLHAQVRGADVVGRLGGDEFGVLVVGGDARLAVERLDVALAAVTGATSGLAIFPIDGQDPEQLHNSADADLYSKKAESRGTGRRRQRELSWAAALAATVDARMSVAHEHSAAVAEYAAAIGERFGWRDEDLDDLRLAAMLHDVGKVHVPERVLRKTGPLDPAEWVELRKHPDTGADLVATVDGLERIAPWIRHSHERVDGRGYPHGLAGEEIPEASRILLVADAFDAMTSDRAYRRAMSPADALDELRRHAGSQFDSRCVGALEEHLAAEAMC